VGHDRAVLNAAFWGFVAASSLLIGAAAALARPWTPRSVGVVMAFGSGVLISSLAFDLVEEALDLGGTTPTAIGVAAGALTYYGGDWLVSRRGGRAHRPALAGPGRPTAAGATDDSPGGATGDLPGDGGGPDDGVGHGGSDDGDGGSDDGDGGSDDGDGTAAAIVVGAVLDGIPESAAIGISLIGGGTVSFVFVAAVFLSNVPEALSASAGLKRGGASTVGIMGLWGLVAVVSTIASAAGFGLLDQAGDATVAALSAYAGGAVLTMLASTMLPEAHREGGPVTGLVTTAGFLLAVLLDAI
jgi:ZIP family zinc transporter